MHPLNGDMKATGRHHEGAGDNVKMSVSPAREPLFQGMDPSLTKENGTKMVQVVPRWRKMGLRWRFQMILMTALLVMTDDKRSR